MSGFMDDPIDFMVYGGVFGRVKQQMDDAAERDKESGDDVGFVTESAD